MDDRFHRLRGGLGNHNYQRREPQVITAFKSVEYSSGCTTLACVNDNDGSGVQDHNGEQGRIIP